MLLLLATATTRVVEAKVSISNNVASSSSFLAATRTLEEALGDNSGKDASTNDIDYVPYENGTEVQFQDQDGTW